MVDKDQKKLPDLIRAYNECKSGTNPDMIDVIQPWRFALMGGADLTTARFFDNPNEEVRYLNATPMQDRSYFQGGVEVIYKTHKISNLVGFYTGIFYNQNEYYQVSRKEYSRRIAPPVQEYNEHSLEYTEIKIPLGFEFSRPTKKKLSYHMRLGIVFPKMLSFSATHPQRDLISVNTVYGEQPSNITEFKRKLILSTAVGCDLRTSDRTRIRLQASWSGGYHKATTQNNLLLNTAPGFSSSIGLATGFIF